MKSFDFCVVGNIFFDTIQILDTYKSGISNLGHGAKIDLGGTINTVRCLLELCDKQTVFLSSVVGDDDIGVMALKVLSDMKKENSSFDYNVKKVSGLTTSAIVLCETETQTRSSVVNWGVCREHDSFYLPPAKWYHFMYLDTLDGVTKNHFTKLPTDSIISMDMCLSSHSKKQKDNILKLLEHVDYGIVSEDSALSITDEKVEIYSAMSLENKLRKAAIVHSPKGSCISTGESQHMVHSNVIKNTKINVLGAGDAFAASFIYNTLDSDNDIKHNTKAAHEYATDFILRDK